MHVLEFQAKRLLRERGIPTPRGVLVRSARDLAPLRFPIVLKAQVPGGRRGKAGAIRVASNPGEAALALEDLLHTAVRGCPARAVLAEEKVEATRELYLGVLIDRKRRAPALLASARGGIDVEEAARGDPDTVLWRAIDLDLGPSERTVRSLATRLHVAGHLGDFRAIVAGAFALFRELDATLVEINPLAETAAGLVALDAKLALDDKASFRHVDLLRALAAEQEAVTPQTTSPAERLAGAAGLTYVPLDGEIGLISNSAGTGMLTLDLILDAGARAAAFCELGGAAQAGDIQRALGAVLENPNVKVVLVALFGGLTRMDDLAEGIVAYRRERGLRVPLVVRMAGTQSDEGRAILHGIGMETLEDLPTAVGEAFRLVKESTWPSL